MNRNGINEKGSSELSSLLTATKRHHIEPVVGKKMFSISIQKKIEKERLVERVKKVNENIIMQKAMKDNYTKFVKELYTSLESN
jgi:hypothetical protein